MMTVFAFGCLGKSSTVQFQPVTGTGGLQCPTAENLVFQDDTTWLQFWLKYCKAFDDRGTVLPAPTVDFEKYTLVGIFLGQRPSGGYGVAIKNIKKAKNELQVSIEERKPKPTDMVILMITYPYALVTVEKTTLPLKVIAATKKD
jgi:hypothetical protein